MEQQITVPVSLNEKTFKRFSRFDTLRLRKKWVRPAVFALILVAFGFIALLTKKAQAGLIAAVLMVVGLGLPLVYFGTFFSQVNVQATRMKLGKGRRVYTVCLDENGIRVQNDQKAEQHLSLPWKDVQAAFRVKGCTYLYVSPVRAFLLPDGQADAGDEALWACLTEHMGEKAKSL